MRALALRPATEHRTLPLFGLPAPSRQKISLEGWCYGDAIELADLRNPGCWQRGRVICVSLRLHEIHLRVGDRIVSLNPILHPQLVRRPKAAPAA